jgi:hypothetical protein
MKTSNFGIVIVILVLILGGLYVYSRSTMNDVQIDIESTQGTPTNFSDMSFFITSANPSKGANLGGLDGADRYCQSLATAVGAGDVLWRAYLSTQATAETPAINARDRIGNGPWRNAKGVVVANTIEELHGTNNLTKETALTETGRMVSGRGDEVNQHDILTGSTPEGLAIATTSDVTCGNWTIDTDDGASAMVGHHDRVGLRDDEPSRSWNSSHLTRGCSAEALPQSGGAGLFYCFAVVE